MNAKKAFNRVIWKFMQVVLQYFGSEHKFLNWIRSTASLEANSIISKPFNISNDTRQDCPFSSLLFILLLEPFVCKIRANLRGVHFNGNQYKMMPIWTISYSCYCIGISPYQFALGNLSNIITFSTYNYPKTCPLPFSHNAILPLYN